MYLIQDYVEELDKEGLVVLLDMEKAFDRCSWTFLKDSMEAIGIGPRLRRWVGMIYSEETPPKRKLHINGQKGASFALSSGVAQGCPLSPLLFLFIGEVSHLPEQYKKTRNSRASKQGKRNIEPHNSPTTRRRM